MFYLNKTKDMRWDAMKLNSLCQFRRDLDTFDDVLLKAIAFLQVDMRRYKHILSELHGGSHDSMTYSKNPTIDYSIE
jgi:hypothetical protein